MTHKEIDIVYQRTLAPQAAHDAAGYARACLVVVHKPDSAGVSGSGSLRFAHIVQQRSHEHDETLAFEPSDNLKGMLPDSSRLAVTERLVAQRRHLGEHILHSPCAHKHIKSPHRPGPGEHPLELGVAAGGRDY